MRLHTTTMANVYTGGHFQRGGMDLRDHNYFTGVANTAAFIKEETVNATLMVTMIYFSSKDRIKLKDK